MQKQRLQSLTLIMLSPFFCTGQTIAFGSEMDLFALNLEQLLAIEVSTLNKRPQSHFQLPAASYILNRKEIERSGALTIPDLLARVPGVFVKQLSSDFTAVSVRNDVQVFNTSLLVLIDGNPFYLPVTSNAFWSALPVAVEEIERIEVIRGDGGTAWGTNHIESRLWGVELLLGWDVTQALHTDLGLTWFHKESEVQDGRYRGEINEQYAPEYKVTLNSRYRFSEKTDLSLFLLYEAGHSTQAATLYTPTGQTDDHFRLDGSLNHHFSPQGSLSLGFKNLFNSAVEWDYPFAVAQPVEVEPSVWLKLGYQFD